MNDYNAINLQQWTSLNKEGDQRVSTPRMLENVKLDIAILAQINHKAHVTYPA